MSWSVLVSIHQLQISECSSVPSESECYIVSRFVSFDGRVGGSIKPSWSNSMRCTVCLPSRKLHFIFRSCPIERSSYHASFSDILFGRPSSELVFPRRRITPCFFPQRFGVTGNCSHAPRTRHPRAPEALLVTSQYPWQIFLRNAVVKLCQPYRCFSRFGYFRFDQSWLKLHVMFGKSK